MTDRADDVQWLRDRAEIQDVLYRYCRAVDRLDLDLLKDVYHPEGSDNHGSFSGNAHAFADYIIPHLRDHVAYGFHTVTHSLIDIRGDEAGSESYYYGYHRIPGGWDAVSAYFGEAYAARWRDAGRIESEHEYVAGGRYIDHLVRHEGRWRIFSRTLTNEWSQASPLTHDRDAGGVAAYNLPGARDRSDPAYAFAKGVGSVAMPV